MSLTILAHIYNESYLLPWWLAHHTAIADHGIIFDYASTDDSVAICRALAPTWDIGPSRNHDFDAIEVDREMMDAERQVDGWKIVLNVTEFLVGDVRAAMVGERQILRSRIMVDRDQHTPDPTRPLVEQYADGYYDDMSRPGRLLHRQIHGNYPTGRHMHDRVTTDDCAVWWYGWAPWTPETRARKLQIQTRIPPRDKEQRRGWHHCVDEAQLDAWYLANRGRL